MTTPNNERPGSQPPFSPGEWGCLLFAAIVGIILLGFIVL